METKIIVGIVMFILGAVIQILSIKLMNMYREEKINNTYWIFITSGTSFWLYCKAAELIVF